MTAAEVLPSMGKFIVVNKQTESHKGFMGFIFNLQEVELLYNDVHHSRPTL